MALYLRLYHGRKTANESMDSWGFESQPIEIEAFGYTYDNLWYVINDERIDLKKHEDLIFYQGNFYGDFEITTKL